MILCPWFEMNAFHYTTCNMFQKSVETVKSAPVKSTESTTTMTTRSRLAVRQVENDQVAAKKSVPEKEKETWVWFVADHAVLILFILVSIIALSFTVERWVLNSKPRQILNICCTFLFSFLFFFFF